MNTDFVGDEVTRLRGIMNGCTNFMLTKMEAEGLSYADCLAEATALAEACKHGALTALERFLFVDNPGTASITL